MKASKKPRKQLNSLKILPNTKKMLIRPLKERKTVITVRKISHLKQIQ